MIGNCHATHEKNIRGLKQTLYVVFTGFHENYRNIAEYKGNFAEQYDEMILYENQEKHKKKLSLTTKGLNI